MIERDALPDGERYVCRACGAVVEENYYPAPHTEASARKAGLYSVVVPEGTPCECEIA